MVCIRGFRESSNYYYKNRNMSLPVIVLSAWKVWTSFENCWPQGSFSSCVRAIWSLLCSLTYFILKIVLFKFSGSFQMIQDLKTFRKCSFSLVVFIIKAIVYITFCFQITWESCLTVYHVKLQALFFHIVADSTQVWPQLQRAGSVGGSDPTPGLGGCPWSDLEYGRSPEVWKEVVRQLDPYSTVLVHGWTDD